MGESLIEATALDTPEDAAGQLETLCAKLFLEGDLNKDRALTLREIKLLVIAHGKEGDRSFNQGVGTTAGEKGRTAKAAYNAADTDENDLVTWPEWSPVCTSLVPWADEINLSTESYEVPPPSDSPPSADDVAFDEMSRFIHYRLKPW